MFSEARSLLSESNREIALVLEWKEKTMAFGVDSVETVEKLSESNIDGLAKSQKVQDSE